ncbi:type III secretion system export apparatus subunit SctV [Myxococcota bacterium]|nr:type III secretion system export apparatus subunit SctV [Myxococcota bacterium]
MKMFQSLAALPLRELGRRPDVVLAIMVTMIVGMLIIPIPGLLLDPLIAVNIAASLMVLLVALFAKNALEVSSFPTLLLITTLFRLGLNVSTTRGILAKADAGEMVKAFGEFVVQGDVVVGTVIFLVITLVQFLVVAKGSERVAEVGARFTLDAMPGKQMSIDAGVRSGAYTEEEAQEKRDELNRASQMFGNMDGAMKFVKGDAIAGLVIMALNVIAGTLIGVLRMGMSGGQALETFAVLTIGDALVAQISALLITLAAGILVTRVEAKDKTKNLGFSLKEELLSNAKVLNIGAGLMVAMSLIPGLPMIPFLLCAAIVASISASAKLFKILEKKMPKTPGQATLAKQVAFKDKLEKKVEEAKKQKSLTDRLAPTVVPIGIDLDPVLSLALGFEDEESDDEAELVATYIPQLRDALYLETGVRFPGVRVRPHMKNLPESSFMVRINDVPVLQDRLPGDHFLATAHPDKLVRLGITAQAVQHPVSKAKMSLITKEQKEVVESAGVTVWNGSGMIALYVASVLRKRAKDFIGLQEVSDTIERLEKAYPALVKEVIPKVVTLSQLVSVLRRLVDEGVCIRDMKSIIEALGEFGTRDGDGLFLTEKVRAALGSQLAHSYAGLENRLAVLLLDPVIEETIAGSISQNMHGQVLSMEPEICRSIVQTVAASLQPMVAKGKRPVILTSAEIRRFVRKLLETDLPQVAVLSYDELPSDLTVQPMGRAQLSAGS